MEKPRDTSWRDVPQGFRRWSPNRSSRWQVRAEPGFPAPLGHPEAPRRQAAQSKLVAVRLLTPRNCTLVVSASVMVVLPPLTVSVESAEAVLPV